MDAPGDGGLITAPIALGALRPVIDADGPYASAYVDATHDTEDADRILDLRARAACDRLVADGAPASLVDTVQERLTRPTGHGGTVGRGVVATPDGVLIDQLLPQPPTEAVGRFGPIPYLLPYVCGHAENTPYVVVTVDHAGADIVCTAGGGLDKELVRSEGEHEVLHPVPGGGWSHRRFRSRVEDSWDRNGQQVAADVDDVLGEHAAEAVFLVGDPYSRSVLHRYATPRVADRLVDLGDGSRAEGSSDEHVEAAIREWLQAHARSRCDDALEEFLARRGQGGAVADGLAEVVRSLRDGSAERVLLADHPRADHRLWAGPDPQHLGLTKEEVTSLGATETFPENADELVLRGLVGIDGHLQFVGDGRRRLTGGIAALLRYDASAG